MKNPAYLCLAFAIGLSLAGCLSPKQAQTVGTASTVAVDIGAQLAPSAVAKFDAACPKLQAAAKSAADVAAFTGVSVTAQQQIAQDQALLAGSCTEAGKQQLAVNDTAPPGPTNSGDSLGWMNTVLTDALAVAKVASVVVPLL